MNNPYIRKQTVKRFIVAAMLSSVVYQINGLTDSLIVGHAVTPDALSAIGLAAPIMSILLLLSGIVCSGACLLAAKWIGAQKYADASKMKTACLSVMFVIYSIVTVMAITFSKEIANLLTDEPRLLVLLYDYLPVEFVYICLLSVVNIFFNFINIAGKPMLVTKSLTILCVANILLDFLFVVALGLGIRGAAWATLISCIISNLVYIKYYFGKECIYPRQKLQFKWAFPMFLSAIKTGLPNGISTVASSVMMVVLNALVLKMAGADGMFVLTVGLQMLVLCNILMSGTAGVITSIGSLLLGEKDLDGYRSMVINCRKRTIVAVILVTLIMIAIPGGVARLFGASDELLAYSRTPLREFCLLFIPYCIISLFSQGYIVQGHRLYASLIQVGMLVCLVLAALSLSEICPQHIWLTGFFGLLLLQGLVAFTSWMISHRHNNLHPLTLIEKYPEFPSVYESVSYNRESVPAVLDKINRFVGICDLEPQTVSHIMHCVSELSYHIVDMAVSTGHSGYFDVRVVDTDEGILVVIKDDNAPYNPIFPYKPEEGQTVEEEQIALTIINAMCPDIKHQYMNGVNCTYLRWKD